MRSFSGSNESLLYSAGAMAMELSVISSVAVPEPSLKWLEMPAPLLAALSQGKQDPPLRWPRRESGSRWTGESRERLAKLKAWRDEEAASLGLSAGLVWSARHLDQVALHPGRDPLTLDLGRERDGAPWVRRWQWLAMGQRLSALVAALEGP